MTLATILIGGSVWEIVQNTSAFGSFILLVLLFMSLVSWVIIFHKWRQFRTVDGDNSRFTTQFQRAGLIADSLGQAKSTPYSPLAQIFLAGYNELLDLRQKKNQGGAMQERTVGLEETDYEIVEMTMEKALTEQIGFLERKVIFLASTANSAPFLGLLGTVVGIMDSFWSIGELGSASLAVVAPGIAEALLATIVGLAAAIPAVIAFNWANNRLKVFNDEANGFVLAFIAKARKEER